ncbi:MAG TPA: hypothetical protein VNK48_14590 [Xanthobacteraceae bacterium]|nr:hypothetical protein [Xanthobacteraceae bacterium]
MIWLLLDMLARPEAYAITVRNGELFIEPVGAVQAAGGQVR